jgi:tRNA(fMet)-specific endonuclease VapC
VKYLLDTNWAIYYLRGDTRTIERLTSLKNEGLAISVISVAELYEGVFRSPNPDLAERVLKDFFGEVSVLGVGEEVGRIFGRERVRLRQSGRLISDFDLLIAATALHHNLTLLSADRDFERVENLRIISA